MVAALLGLSACSTDGGEATNEGPTATQETLVPSRRPPELDAGCEAYEAALNSWASKPGTRADDVQFADDLDGIAEGQAKGTSLQEPLAKMASEYRAAQHSISGSAINALCSGNDIPAPEGGDRRAPYLAEVRKQAPLLRTVADDDLIAAAHDVCGFASLAARKQDPQPRSNADIVAATAMGRDDDQNMRPVVDAALSAYCPEHAGGVL